VKVHDVEHKVKAQVVQISFAEYCDLRRVNATTLLTYAGRSAEEARHEQLFPKDDTESLVKGHAAHAALLEPDVFAKLYATMPNFGDYRTKAAKEKRAAWEKEHQNSISINEEQHATAVSIRDRILADPELRQLFDGPGKNESTILWTDEETGLECKARTDRLTIFKGYQILIDLKTARNITDYGCQSAMADLGYAVRMAFYRDALDLVQPADWRVALVWALNTPPYTYRMTELMDEDLAEGRAAYRHYLNLHAECLANDAWPGYPIGFEPLGLPPRGFRFTQKTF